LESGITGQYKYDMFLRSRTHLPQVEDERTLGGLARRYDVAPVKTSARARTRRTCDKAERCPCRPSTRFADVFLHTIRFQFTCDVPQTTKIGAGDAVILTRIAAEAGTPVPLAVWVR
jgi:hypothetical protein